MTYEQDIRWWQAHNRSGEDIPPHSCVQLGGTTKLGQQIVAQALGGHELIWQIMKPSEAYISAGKSANFAFTWPHWIAKDGYGKITFDFPVRATHVSDSKTESLVVSEGVGPVADEWHVASGNQWWSHIYHDASDPWYPSKDPLKGWSKLDARTPHTIWLANVPPPPEIPAFYRFYSVKDPVDPSGASYTRTAYQCLLKTASAHSLVYHSELGYSPEDSSLFGLYSSDDEDFMQVNEDGTYVGQVHASFIAPTYSYSGGPAILRISGLVGVASQSTAIKLPPDFEVPITDAKWAQVDHYDNYGVLQWRSCNNITIPFVIPMRAGNRLSLRASTDVEVHAINWVIGRQSRNVDTAIIEDWNGS